MALRSFTRQPQGPSGVQQMRTTKNVSAHITTITVSDEKCPNARTLRRQRQWTFSIWLRVGQFLLNSPWPQSWTRKPMGSSRLTWNKMLVSHRSLRSHCVVGPSLRLTKRVQGPQNSQVTFLSLPGHPHGPAEQPRWHTAAEQHCPHHQSQTSPTLFLASRKIGPW